MRKDNYTLLIVCEGENTERAYFQSISDLAQNNSVVWTEGINITISPILRTNEKEDFNTSHKINHKKKRKQRKLQAARTLTQNEIEDKYKAEPIRFVREAQLGLKDGAFDEAWAVFDYDNRNCIHAAFDLANSGDKKVKIAYSNYSFEMWVLMHFEKNKTAFSASECREKKEILNCNSGIHLNDCYGSKCISGYLRKKEYLIESTKETISLYPKLENSLEFAFHNAAWLRKQYNLSQSLDKLTAYTDVDYLVKRLFNRNDLIKWIGFNNDFLIKKTLKIRFESDKNKIVVKIANESQATEIIEKEAICLEDDNHNKVEVGKRIVLQSSENKKIEVSLDNFQQYKYASFQYENEKIIASLPVHSL